MNRIQQAVADRRQAIIQAVRAASSYAAGARTMGITRERAHQVVRKFEPELHAELKRAEIPEHHREAWPRWRGIKNRAHRDNVACTLTLPELAAMLEEAQERLGRTKLVVVRKNAKRPWTRANTMVVTHHQASAMRGVDGTIARILAQADRTGQNRTTAELIRRATLLASARQAPESERLIVRRYRNIARNCQERHLAFEITYQQYHAVMAAALERTARLKRRTRHSAVCMMIDKTKGYIPGNIRAGTQAEACSTRRNPARRRRAP